MKVRPILQQTRFGSDAAENDDELTKYFVQTSSFVDIVDDQADLILGPKGSGKSAIFRVLANPDVAISQLRDADIVPAFNLQGASLFQRLLYDAPEATEAQLRAAWWTYILGLVGNHLVDTYSATSDDAADRLSSTLEAFGLRRSEDRPRSLWAVVVDGLRRLVHPSRVEGGLTYTEQGFPLFTGAIEFDTAQQGSGAEPQQTHVPFEDLLALEIAVLDKLERRVWVAFDRLDEAFIGNPDFERSALRGLMRAHLDVSSFGRRLRTKLFLRTDIFDRITEKEGFVNVTHIRTLRISWDEATLEDLVARRALENEVFRNSFGLTTGKTTSPKLRREVLRALFPEQVDVGTNKPEAFAWVLRRMTDGTGQLNPRNVITFLRAARDRQLQICDREDPDTTDRNQAGALLSRPALRDAWPDVSGARLEDTLFAEFAPLRPLIEKFKGGKATHNRDTLAEILGLSPESSEFDEVVSSLVYAGFLAELPTSYSVPFLYRPALDVTQGAAFDS